MLVPLATVVVPGVIVPADADMVHVEPSVQVWPLTVVAAFTRSALVTSPVAVNAPVMVGLAIVGDVAETGDPVPVVAVNDGAAVDPVKLPYDVFAAAVDKEKVSAGVLVAVATDDVNSGERLPAENDVTDPPPPPPHPVQVPLTVRLGTTTVAVPVVAPAILPIVSVVFGLEAVLA